MKRYRITSVDYDITQSDVAYIGETIAQVLARLPQTMDIEVEDTDLEEYGGSEGLDRYLADEVTWSTDWLVNSLTYEEIK